MMEVHSLLGDIVLSGTILICALVFDWEMKSRSLERDGRASPSLSNVDYVDHSAELYELPAKVSSGCLGDKRLY